MEPNIAKQLIIYPLLALPNHIVSVTKCWQLSKLRNKDMSGTKLPVVCLVIKKKTMLIIDVGARM